ncbi:hypothetical protein Tco_0866362 [Tanacetum coccineum]
MSVLQISVCSSVSEASSSINCLFPSVLLSSSGEYGYRINSISGGSFVIDNLFAGSFYLRLMLKVLVLDINRENYEIGLPVIEKAGVSTTASHMMVANSILLAQITVKDLLDADMSNDGLVSTWDHWPLRLEIKRKLAQRSKRVKRFKRVKYVDLHLIEPCLYSKTRLLWVYLSQVTKATVDAVNKVDYIGDFLALVSD